MDLQVTSGGNRIAVGVTEASYKDIPVDFRNKLQEQGIKIVEREELIK
jgi:hypothetical protein